MRERARRQEIQPRLIAQRAVLPRLVIQLGAQPAVRRVERQIKVGRQLVGWRKVDKQHRLLQRV